MGNDWKSKKKPATGGLIDLPLGPQEGGRKTPSKPPSGPPRGEREPGTGDTQPVPPRRRPPGEIGEPGTTPRHQRPRRAARPRRRIWPWLLLLFVAAAGGGYWFLFRPPVAEAGAQRVEFTPTRVGRPGEEALVEVFNRGRRPLVVSGLSLDGPAGDDFSIREDGCTGRSLGPDEGCAATVFFEPSLSGARDASLTVASNGVGEPLTIAVSGSGLAPSLTVGPSRLDFGRVAVGKASEAAALNLSNSGTAPLAIARLAVEGSGESSYVWVANGCSGETLAPGDQCAVRLAFRPGDSGEFKAELRAWSDAPEDPRIELYGLGIAPGLFVLPSRLDFGETRPGVRTDARTVTFENTGNAALELQRVELTGGGAGAFDMTRNDCDGRTLAEGDTCEVAVRYAPGDPARHQAALRVRASGLRQRREVPLEGAALAPRIALDATVVDFGQVVEYATNVSSVEIRNTGSAALELTGFELAGGGGAFGVSERTCETRLAAGASCTVTLRFSPSRVGGVDGELRVTHNAPGSPSSVRLLGTGTPLPKGEIALDPRALDFGSLPVGERSDILTVKVRSVGTARLELAGYEISGPGAGDFRVVPASCEGLSSLLPDSDCTIGVRFRAQAAGASRARLVVRHAGGVIEVALSGEGF